MDTMLKSHDDLIELLYQTVMPAVHAVFYCMFTTLEDRCDSKQVVIDSLKYSMKSTKGWNATQVKEVASSWTHIEKQTMCLVDCVVQLNGRMMHENGLIPEPRLDMHTRFPDVLHVILTAASKVLVNNTASVEQEHGLELMSDLLEKERVVQKAIMQLSHDSIQKSLKAQKLAIKEDRSHRLPVQSPVHAVHSKPVQLQGYEQPVLERQDNVTGVAAGNDEEDNSGDAEVVDDISEAAAEEEVEEEEEDQDKTVSEEVVSTVAETLHIPMGGVVSEEVAEAVQAAEVVINTGSSNSSSSSSLFKTQEYIRMRMQDM